MDNVQGRPNNMPIKVFIAADYDQMSKKATGIIADTIKNKPDSVLGLATGGTLVGCYQELVRMHKEEGHDFSRVVTFNLDEYIGLAPTHPQSYRYFMDENLFNHVNIKMENTNIPDGLSDNPQKTCNEFEEAIRRSGGIDLQLLGIGANGHIAFNEPGSSFDSKTRIVELSEKTREDNARFFESKSDVPKRAISMGIGTIRKADQILLIASGKRKAEAVAKALEGPIKEDVPASILQKHPDCKFIIDEEAAKKT